jgi:predicted O-linked N-acetylglucosamine transferase (SPINDLY family)
MSEYKTLLASAVPAHETVALDALRRGALTDASVLLGAAVYLRPDMPTLRSNLARALLASGRSEEAWAAANQAVALDETFAPSFDALGAVAFAIGRPGDAERAFRSGLDLAPDDAARWGNLGIVLLSTGRLVEAVDVFRRALEIDPRHGPAAASLVSCFSELGRFDEAEVARRAAPPGTRCSPLFTLADPSLSAAEVGALYRAHAAELGEPSPDPHTNEPSPQRRLRVGYLSGDLRAHSTTCFLMPVLRLHDRTDFEVFAYANSASGDGVTDEIRDLVGSFQIVIGLTDDELERRVRADGIDILIDPAGWTSDHRLPVFARKPAPVTVGMLGNPVLVDAYLTDALVDPLGMTDDLVGPELVRLPASFQCFNPPRSAPDVAPLPALTNGHVTFGSFNALYKMNDGVIAAWAAVLRRCPGSRMLIKCKPLVEDATRRGLEERFGRFGIEASRLSLVPHEPSRVSHLGRYAEVDVCLDTFPYNGTTTTCESLWMGVPVVTLAGRSHIARTGVSVLTNAGLPELVAEDIDAFVDVGVGLATDVPRLAALRRGMRERLRRSPLLAAEAYTRDFEAALRRLWQRWCQTRSS